MIQPLSRPEGQSAFFISARATEPRRRRETPTTQGGVLACVGDAPMNGAVIGHALAISKSLDLPVTLARVLEVPRSYGVPADPVEWQNRRSRGREQLERMARIDAPGTPEIDSVLLSGSPAEELRRWAADHHVAMMVLGTRDGGDGEAELGSTAQGLLASASASLLMVPPAAHAVEQGYRRLLVPLDGSSRAESVIPVAVRIARAHRAELVLVHVVPPPAPGLLGGGAHELRDQLDARNDETARTYLARLRHGMIGEPLPVRTIVARGGDPRTQLRRLAADEAADLIVVASHGASGLADLPCGSVTHYLATHAPAPLLIVRTSFRSGAPAKQRAGSWRVGAAADQ